jgi:hypothetical protein
VNWSLMMMKRMMMTHKKDNLMKSIVVQSGLETNLMMMKMRMTYKKDNLMKSIGVQSVLETNLKNLSLNWSSNCLNYLNCLLEEISSKVDLEFVLILARHSVWYALLESLIHPPF